MIYSDITDRLCSAGIDVALPGARSGLCSAPYAVVQHSGTFRYAASRRLGYSLITVHCYVPLFRYDQLDILIRKVKSALKSLEPDLRYQGTLSPHIINDNFRAHEASLQYIIQRRTIF